MSLGVRDSESMPQDRPIPRPPQPRPLSSQAAIITAPRTSMPASPTAVSPLKPSSRSARLAAFPWREALVAVALFTAMTFHQRSLEPSVVALQFVYHREDFAAIVRDWGAGAALLPWNLLIDLPFMMAYGLFGYRMATRTALAIYLPAGLRPCFPWLLPAAAGTDAVENLLEFYLAGHLETAADSLFLAAGLISAGKWALIAIFAAATLAALVRQR